MLYERLDARVLLATISGVVWNDVDSSTTYDAGESVVKNAVVYLDANANGRFDPDERSEATDKRGRYDFKELKGDDSYLIGVVAPAGQGLTRAGPLGSEEGAFDIELTGTDALAPAVRRAFAEAAARWESIIIGDLPAIDGIDDVRISVSVAKIDGVGGTLAQAGPDGIRPGSRLPYTGDMEFDSADIQTLMSEGHFVDTVTHEMAHVLGFGTVWSDLGLFDDRSRRNPRFTGEQATKAYNELFGTDEDSVPVESTGGSGTADSHWPESTFVEELMTGYDEDRGTAEPLSRITVAQFADLGYQVNLNAADQWNPLTHKSVATTPLDLGARPFEQRIFVGRDSVVTNANIGVRDDTGPVVGRFVAPAAVLGETTLLRADRLRDAEGDAITGVRFYADTNGTPGLQGGRGGDTLLATVAAASSSGVYSATVSTAGLTAGSQAFYAIATDSLGLSGRRGTTTTLTLPPPPTRPNPVVATRQSKSSTLLQWRDRSTSEIGFRIEISTDPTYTNVLRAFNVPADSAASLVTGLARGTYFVRIRAYGYGGASAYTRLTGVRV